MADKLALAITPAWLYIPMTRATGELAEYMGQAEKWARSGEPMTLVEQVGALSGDERCWFAAVQSYMRRWVSEHANGKMDTWTYERRTRNE